uniref:Coenzyme Q-binding protein COQ10 START domain-containing protein n=1 Tax=Picea sitchensis TaxID=3332 RepID=A9NQF5_PICSI|nr:unknown [Picea sitchensis]
MECSTYTLKVQSPLQFSPSKSPHLTTPISHANLIRFQAFQVPNGLHFLPIKFTHGRKPIALCRAVENVTVGADDTSEENKEEIDNVEEIVDLKIEVEAPLDAVWNVLTDYERLADFIPGLAVSQLLERRENGARLLQFEGGTGNQSISIKKDFRTLLSYTLDVQPKRWLPVALVEGRLSREIHINLTCVRSQVMSIAFDALPVF